MIAGTPICRIAMSLEGNTPQMDTYVSRTGPEYHLRRLNASYSFLRTERRSMTKTEQSQSPH